jgi:hypothetical protein
MKYAFSTFSENNREETKDTKNTEEFFRSPYAVDFDLS